MYWGCFVLYFCISLAIILIFGCLQILRKYETLEKDCAFFHQEYLKLKRKLEERSG